MVNSELIGNINESSAILVVFPVQPFSVSVLPVHDWISHYCSRLALLVSFVIIQRVAYSILIVLSAHQWLVLFRKSPD